MNLISKALCILLAFGLATSVQAAGQPRPATPLSAKTKVIAKAKAQARLKSRVKARPIKSTHVGTQKHVARLDPVDESSLDADVAAARRLVNVNPKDVEARERLASASVVVIDWLLRAEAVGDEEKVLHLVQKLGKDLHDTGWRVQNMSQRGDLMARQAAGFLLGRGLLLKKDPVKSCAEFIAAAEKLAPAGWHAAQCLMETSPALGWVQMERAARRGHAAAQEWMGRRCLGEFGGSDKDFACARTYLGQSASLGRPRAQTLLAFLLIEGQGGAPDVGRAIGLYKAAADRGDVNAQNNLGEIYETGRGVTRNLGEALRWYERAAEKGLGSAQFNAGRLWAIGVGESKDPAKARALLLQAEGNGVVQARQVLDWLDRQGAPEPDRAPGLKPATELRGDTVKE